MHSKDHFIRSLVDTHTELDSFKDKISGFIDYYWTKHNLRDIGEINEDEIADSFSSSEDIEVQDLVILVNGKKVVLV
jgi:hypothetical protein